MAEDTLTQQMQPKRDVLRDIILPLASIFETVATAKASKGRFVGTSAADEIRRQDEQRKTAIERAAQAKRQGMQDRLTEAKIKNLSGKKKEKSRFTERQETFIKDLEPETKKHFILTGKLPSKDKPETLTGKDKFDMERKLRQEFDGLSKDFRKVRDSYGRIQASAKDPSPAGDLALIFNYMKVLDPGSVVRESEFATAENARAALENAQESGETVPNFIWGIINKLSTGQRMLRNQRLDFVNRAGRLFQSQADIQRRQINRFTNIAKADGLRPEVIIDPITLKAIAETPLNPEDDTSDSVAVEKLKLRAREGDQKAVKYLNSKGIPF